MNTDVPCPLTWAQLQLWMVPALQAAVLKVGSRYNRCASNIRCLFEHLLIVPLWFLGSFIPEVFTSVQRVVLCGFRAHTAFQHRYKCFCQSSESPPCKQSPVTFIQNGTTSEPPAMYDHGSVENLHPPVAAWLVWTTERVNSAILIWFLCRS